MAKKRKQTQAEKEYKKQRGRIQRFIKSAEKRGYMFDQRVLPDVPKRITKASVQRLAKITPSVLYKKAVYYTPSGDLVSGEKGRALERSLVAQKGKSKVPKVDKSGITKAGQPPSRTDSTISSIEELINRFPSGFQKLSEVEDLIQKFPNGENWTQWQYEIHEHHKNVLQGMLDTQIMIYGRNVVAMRLDKSTDDVVGIAERIIYGDSKDEQYQVDINSFAQIIKGEVLDAAESRMIEELADEYDV